MLCDFYLKCLSEVIFGPINIELVKPYIRAATHVSQPRAVPLTLTSPNPSWNASEHFCKIANIKYDHLFRVLRITSRGRTQGQ